MTLKNAYAKGARLERWLVNTLSKIGITAKRQPLSGAWGTANKQDEFCGDVTSEIGGLPFRFECKHRANGFKTLETWIEKHDALLIKRDRKAPMVVLTWDAFARLSAKANES